MINIALPSLLPPFVFVLLMVTDTLAANPVSSIGDASPDSAYLEQLASSMIDRFQITPQQVAQVQSIKAQYLEKLTRLNQAIEQRDRKLNKQIINSATPKEIREEHSEIAALKQQWSDTLLEQFLEMRSAFTPNQLQQIAQQLGSLKR